MPHSYLVIHLVVSGMRVVISLLFRIGDRRCAAGYIVRPDHEVLQLAGFRDCVCVQNAMRLEEDLQLGISRVDGFTHIIRTQYRIRKLDLGGLLQVV